MRRGFLNSLIMIAVLLLIGPVGFAGAKSNPKKTEEGQTAEPSHIKVAEEGAEKASRAPHATGKERAAEVGKGKKKGLEKQGYEIGSGQPKAPKPEEEEETEPAIIIGETSTDKKPEKSKTEPQTESKKPTGKTESEPTAEQPQKNQGGGFGR